MASIGLPLGILACVSLAPTPQRERGVLPVQVFRSEEIGANAQVRFAVKGPGDRVFVAHVGGCVVFDGARWASVSDAPALCSLLQPSPDGEVWCGAEGGFTTAVRGAGDSWAMQSLPWRGKTSLTFPRVLSFVRPDEAIVVDGREAAPLVRLTRVNGTWGIDRVWPPEPGEVFGAVEVVDTTVYVASSGRGLLRVEDGNLTEVEWGATLKGWFVNNLVRRSPDRWLAFTQQGEPLAFGPGRVVPLSPEARRRLVRAHGATTFPGSHLLVATQRGAVLLDADDRVVRTFGEGARLPEVGVQGPPLNDGQGGAWIPTYGGVSRVDLFSPFETLSRQDGLRGPVTSLQRHDGTLYIGTWSGLYSLKPTAVAEAQVVPVSPERGGVCSLLDLGESFIVGRRERLEVWGPRGPSKPRVLVEGVPGHALAKLSDDEFVAVTAGAVRGFARFDADWTEFVKLETTFAQVMSICVESPDLFWLGGYLGGNDWGVARVELDGDESLVTMYGVEEGLPNTDPSLWFWDDELLVGVADGVLRHDSVNDRFERHDAITNAIQVSGRGAMNTVVDEHGAAWFWTDDGRTARLRRVGDDFVLDHPLTTSEVDDALTFFPEDGVLWVGASSGDLLRVAPEEAAVPAMPQLAVTFDVCDDHGVITSLEPGRDHELGHAGYTVSIRASCPLYAFADGVEFRSLVHGVDSDWQPWSPESVREVEQLGDGSYRIDVEARDALGRIMSRSVGVRVLPPWYTTWWAKSTWLLAALLLVAGLMTLRGRLARRRVQELEREIEERQRVEQSLREEMVEHARTTEERARLQAELQRSQRIDALGRMAGGIAHDFNNLLTIVLGSADLASVSLKDGDTAKVEDGLNQVRGAGRRAADLSRQLLSYSARQPVRPRVVEPTAVVRELLRLLSRLVPDSVEVCFRPTNQPLALFIDPGQFEQVVTNLVLNASQAMPRGGTLSLELTEELVEERSADVLSPTSGRWVRLRVSDTGVGMEPEMLEHIFDPFFTRRAGQEGTGLGLSTVYGIVRQAAGRIDVESAVGKGTTFTADFPAIEPVEAEETQAVSEPMKNLDGTTVLVCDDDDGVRSITRQLLESLGATVLEADRPSCALRIAREPSTEIDVLVADLVMPEMSGDELARCLGSRIPSLHVVLVSGYTPPQPLSTSSDHQEFEVLQKPFSANDLVRTIGGLYG